jgi:hypothetical protein
MHLSTSLQHTIYVHHVYHLHASKSGPGSYDGYRLCPIDIYSRYNLCQCCATATAVTYSLVTCKVFTAKRTMTSLWGCDIVEPDRQVTTLRRNLLLFLFICWLISLLAHYLHFTKDKTTCCVCFPIQFLNCLPDIQKICYMCFAITSYPNPTLVYIPDSVITCHMDKPEKWTLTLVPHNLRHWPTEIFIFLKTIFL